MYRRGRQILIDELGVEPDEECQALVRTILAGGPVDDPAVRASPIAGRVPDVPVPRQLPADVAGFIGRSHLLLGHAWRAAGDRGAAAAHWRRAQVLARDIGLPEAEQAAALLAR